MKTHSFLLSAIASVCVCTSVNAKDIVEEKKSAAEFTKTVVNALNAARVEPSINNFISS